MIFTIVRKNFRGSINHLKLVIILAAHDGDRSIDDRLAEQLAPKHTLLRGKSVYSTRAIHIYIRRVLKRERNELMQVVSADACRTAARAAAAVAARRRRRMRRRGLACGRRPW